MSALEQFGALCFYSVASKDYYWCFKIDIYICCIHTQWHTHHSMQLVAVNDVQSIATSPIACYRDHVSVALDNQLSQEALKLHSIVGFQFLLQNEWGYTKTSGAMAI